MKADSTHGRGWIGVPRMWAVRERNRQVSGASNYKRAAPIFHREDHRIYMLILALDYANSKQRLPSVNDAKHMEELAKQCGVHEVLTLYNTQCTKDAVRRAIRSAGSRCDVNDYFVMYFEGHATALSDPDRQGLHDEALVLVDPNGKASPATLFLEEEFTSLVLENFKPQTRVIVLTDAGHEVAVLDLSQERWKARQIVSISAIEAVRSSGEDCRRGIFVHALLLAIDKLSKVGRDNYSVGMLFNAWLLEDELVFRGLQEIEIQAPSDFSPDAMAWPLVPPAGYQAPLSRCTGPGGILSNASMFGISSALLRHVVQEALNAPVSIEEYLSHVQGLSSFGFKPCRACSAGYSPATCGLQ